MVVSKIGAPKRLTETLYPATKSIQCQDIIMYEIQNVYDCGKLATYRLVRG